MTTAPFFKQITDDIVKRMETAPQDWLPRWASVGMPRNAYTKAHYRGINILALALKGMTAEYSTRYWATVKQWNLLGSQVRKGEKGTAIIYFEPREKVDPVTKEKSTYGFTRYSYVFNAAQTDGWEPPAMATYADPMERDQACDEFITNTKATIKTGGDHAFYRPSTDEITLPPFTQFVSGDAFYATAFHELVHWTGAEKRLNRKLATKLERQEYALEELIAELGSAFTCGILGFDGTLRDDHAQYIRGWIKMLKDHETAIMSAAAAASTAVNYLFELTGSSMLPKEHHDGQAPASEHSADPSLQAQSPGQVRTESGLVEPQFAC
jgi:antirestriction protein ArdC